MLGPTDPGGVTPYQALIRDTRRAKDMSVSELARRANMPRSTVHKIENQPPKDRPADVTVDKLASALGIPRRQILDAVSESLGLRVSHGRPALVSQQLLDQIEALPPERRSMWFEMARALADILLAHSDGLDREATGSNDHEIVPVQTGLPASVTALVDDISARQDEIAAVVARVLREMAEERNQTGQ